MSMRKKGLAVLAVAMLAGPFALGAEPPEAPSGSSLYQEAIKLYWQEKNVAAAEKLFEVLNAAPDSPDGKRADYLLSILFDGKLTPEEAVVLEEKLAQQDAHRAAFFALRKGLKAGSSEENLKRFAEFLSASPSDLWRKMALREMCGITWEDADVRAQPEAARTIMDEALRVRFDECQDALIRMANSLLAVYVRLSDCAKALPLRLMIYTWRSYIGEAQQALQCYFSLGQDEEGRKFIESVIAKAPGDPQTYAVMSYGFSNVRRYEEGLALLDRGFKALGARPPEMVAAQAYIYENQGHLSRAMSILKESGPSYSEDVRMRMDRLAKRLPERYADEWASPVSNVVCIAMGPDNQLCALAKEPWRIVRFDSKGNVAQEMEVAPSQRLQSGYNKMLVHPDGGFQVQNLRLNPDGSLARTNAFSRHVRGMGLGASNSLLILESDKGLSRYDNQGVPVFTNKDAAYLSQARPVAEAGGTIYVAMNNRLVLYDRNGERIKTFGNPGNQPGQFRDIFDVVVDAKGTIYVADTNNERIQIFDPELRFLGVIPIGTTSLAVDSDGAVYVLSFDKITKFAPNQKPADAK